MATVFEYIEIVGTSTSSIEEAVRAAVESVGATRKVAWFEIANVRGRLVDATGGIEYQVTVKFGCKQ